MPATAPARTVGSTLSDTVLVVDDDAAAREHLADVFNSAGYATLEAASGNEALAAARLTPPSAVVLDVTLPGMTGYDVCRTLREEHGQDLPIIFLSSDRTEPLDRVVGLMMGADDYVVAPFAAPELVARIGRALARVQSLRRGSRVRVLTSA